MKTVIGLAWVLVCVAAMWAALAQPWHEGEDPTDDASP